MSDFAITSHWLEGQLDYPDETATHAEIVVSVAGSEISNMFDPDLGSVTLGPRLPAVALAKGLVDNWWTFLHEPRKREDERDFEARHRFDALTRGYVFPPLALWPAGESLTASLLRPDTRFHSQSFAPPDKSGPWTLPRLDVQTALGEFIKSTIERIVSMQVDASALSGGWQRIVESTLNEDELAWCTNAGRLGLDPYDPHTPDLARISEGLSDALFSDLCEAGEASELGRTCDWVRGASIRLQNAPAIPMKGFGAAPRRALDQPGWRDGYDSAKTLRNRLKLPMDPRQSVAALLGDAMEDPRGQLDDSAPASVEGLARRSGSEIRAAVPARSLRQRRFRMCRAAYLAWRVGQYGQAAATPAVTWRQQAGRAFAAELLAPADLLRERVGKTGLTTLALERLASEWTCPPQAIIHQAQNHKIPMRGVETALHNY